MCNYSNLHTNLVKRKEVVVEKVARFDLQLPTLEQEEEFSKEDNLI